MSYYSIGLNDFRDHISFFWGGFLISQSKYCKHLAYLYIRGFWLQKPPELRPARSPSPRPKMAMEGLKRPGRICGGMWRRTSCLGRCWMEKMFFSFCGFFLVLFYIYLYLYDVFF